MDDELVQEYVRRFDNSFNLLDNEQSSVWQIELTEDGLREKQQEFADRILLGEDKQSTDVFESGALIFYGYRLGAVRLKGRNECFTRQDGYKDNALMPFNLDEILNQEMEDDNPNAGASHILEWIINPGSNTDVSDDIIEKMIIPMVRNLCKVTPPGKHMVCTVVIPPVSKAIDMPDWNMLFSEIPVEDLKINIVNYGHLLTLSEDERKYILQYQTDGYREFVVISAYEVIKGHNTCLGCMGFDVDDFDRQYVLQDVKNISILLDNSKCNYKKKENVAEIVNTWEPVKSRFPVKNGFNSFLGNHAVSFGREMYKLTGIFDDAHYDTSQLRAVFRGDQALTVSEACAKMFDETNLYNISLGDMVYVADIIQKDKGFNTVSIRTNRNYKLGTYKGFASNVDVGMIPSIPSNYASFTWKLRKKRKDLLNYHSLNAKKHSIRQIIEAIVDHFTPCTTDTVAEELLFFYKNGEDPSAFFAAKVFLYLSQLDFLEIDSRNEYISNIENVDNVEYKEIDKSTVAPVKKAVRKPVQKSSTIFRSHKSVDSVLTKPIEELELTLRTYNFLRRSGIKTVRDIITDRSEADLLKIRNLGVNGKNEVIRKLKELGVKMN